jgi:hypothetical protein
MLNRITNEIRERRDALLAEAAELDAALAVLAPRRKPRAPRVSEVAVRDAVLDLTKRGPLFRTADVEDALGLARGNPTVRKALRAFVERGMIDRVRYGWRYIKPPAYRSPRANPVTRRFVEPALPVPGTSHRRSKREARMKEARR